VSSSPLAGPSSSSSYSSSATILPPHFLHGFVAVELTVLLRPLRHPAEAEDEDLASQSFREPRSSGVEKIMDWAVNAWGRGRHQLGRVVKVGMGLTVSTKLLDGYGC
jgi:hypothetical protein